MTSEKISGVEWDGNVLVGWVSINGSPIRIAVDQDTVHRHGPASTTRSPGKSNFTEPKFLKG